MPVIDSMKTLRDVEGVLGSFLLGSEGELLERDMSQVFDDDLLAEAGPRIRRMTESLVESGEVPQSAVLHFKDHKLWFKAIAGSTLCVLGTPHVNRPALRMALTLVARRVGSQLSGVPSVKPPAVRPDSRTPPPSRSSNTLISAPAAAPPPPIPPTPPVSAPPSTKRMYRGRPVG